MEIERKYLIDAFPADMIPVGEYEMYQGYLSVMPTVRIRSKRDKKGENYKLTIKSSGALSRHEIELPLTKEQFDELTLVIGKRLIKKDKKVYSLNDGLLLECNLVDGDRDTRFMYAEVEFESEAQANAFVPPAYLGKEVTYDNYYKMNRYWERIQKA